MDTRDHRRPRRGRSLTRALGLVAVTVSLFSRSTVAHSGTTHAGIPHWVLFGSVVVGVVLLAGSVAAVRRVGVSPTQAAVPALGGGIAAITGLIGVVEVQVVGTNPPELVAVYPVLALVVAGSLAVGAVVFTATRYPRRPRYALLGLDLAAWIAYPAVMPNGGYLHPLGYLVALALPVLVGYVVWTDARGIVQGVVRDRTPRLVGGVTGIFVAVLYAFSAGTMTFNPDDGVNAPTDAFLISYDVASPLVVWPAVQWNVPSIPFAGYLSVGSLLTMLLFGGLVGLNAAVVTQQLSGSRSIKSGRLFAGTTAMTGATACCCCAPAFYGLLSVLVGTTATPIYWSFIIPASPVSGTFLSGSVLLLLWSLIRSSGGRRDTSGSLPIVDVDSTVTSRLTEE